MSRTIFSNLSRTISWVHILVGIGLLFWLGSKKVTSFSSAERNTIVAVGVAVMAYHLFLFHQRGSWIYLLHALVVAPTIIYFGMYPQEGTSALTLIALVMVIYHSFRLKRF